MFVTPNGEKIFIVDGHIHLWDAREQNRRNRYGLAFIESFWGAHVGSTPPDERWDFDRFCHYGVDGAAKDLFVDGYVDAAIMLPVDLYDFYIEGFNTTEQCAAFKRAYPDKVVLNGRCDPRNGPRGLERLEADHSKYGFKGVKLYTGEWNGVSKGYTLRDDFVVPYLEKCRELGVKIIHVHKGPTTHPLNLDAFDVRDVDHIATAFPDLTFVVDHCGMPRIDDFCWIAAQEPNVMGGLALITSFVYARPKYFGQMLSDLLYFLGPDRILFGSDYGIMSPKWIIEHFMAYEFPEDLAKEAGTPLTLDVKRKILGLNAANLYGLEVPADCRLPSPLR
ncbi:MULTISPECIES: amidohydrolase family protein [unclassified Rhizobium]|uniref:amidohydrolase family protein n=1 Tax=unclassified Rhizobium TaxID=2613769 RepID=UPI0007E967E9|nr:MULTISPECIES: amidohydrolase family protein [unclassified Rhizobium]ANM14434.1 amidohydrolase 2 family protein [Rhizobium sp. N324]ANM20819.1 amidohydrolase 2 family protein [Rhizobium sp. N541]ANM27202.1 amidohydrolase 2 family protein [Rhizobium sp. N941]OWV85813.1 amidohydrolase [Rhizobium sp. N122]OYC99533.1 amidohydrolase 2 family protein [Rhizobium sp. N4311]